MIWRFQFFLFRGWCWRTVEWPCCWLMRSLRTLSYSHATKHVHETTQRGCLAFGVLLHQYDDDTQLYHTFPSRTVIRRLQRHMPDYTGGNALMGTTSLKGITTTACDWKGGGMFHPLTLCKGHNCKGHICPTQYGSATSKLNCGLLGASSVLLWSIDWAVPPQASC